MSRSVCTCVRACVCDGWGGAGGQAGGRPYAHCNCRALGSPCSSNDLRGIAVDLELGLLELNSKVVDAVAARAKGRTEGLLHAVEDDGAVLERLAAFGGEDVAVHGLGDGREARFRGSKERLAAGHGLDATW